jgi:four helix bundle protein
MHKYRDLQVWQRSIAFTGLIYRETRNWPSDEKFGLTSQIRRASCSIPMNIAEGSACSTNKGFCRYLETALGSCNEVSTAISIALSLEFLLAARAQPLQKEADEIAAMIVGLMKSLGWSGSAS